MKAVVVRVTGRFLVSIPDDSNLEEAKLMADLATSEADFGQLNDVEWKLVHLETEDGKYQYFE